MTNPSFYNPIKGPVFQDRWFRTRSLLAEHFGKDPLYQNFNFTQHWDRCSTKEIPLFKQEGMDHDILTWSEDGHWVCLAGEPEDTRISIFQLAIDGDLMVAELLELLMLHLMYKGILEEGTYLITYDW